MSCRYSSLSRSCLFFFFFSSRRRHTRLVSDWSSDVCSSDLMTVARTFTLGGRTQAMAISADLQELYVADETLSALRIVNLPSGTTDTPVAQIGRASCRERV